MGTIGGQSMTLLDRMIRSNSMGQMLPVAEYLQSRSPLLKGMVVKETNEPLSELVAYRYALPPVSYVGIGQGIDSGKSGVAQFREGCATMETRNEIPKKLMEVNGGGAEFRFSEQAPNLDALNQEAEAGMFYNSVLSDPEKWNGLAVRFDATSQALGGSQMVLADAAASGSDQTSIWLVGWSERTVYGIYPKGTQGGISNFDGGLQLVNDPESKKFWAYVMDWTFRLGLVVRDYRYVARVCNIDTSAISAIGDNIMPAMIRAWHKIPNKEGVRLNWYMNGTMGEYAHLQAIEKSVNSTWSIGEAGGEELTKFMRAPIYTSDHILKTEAVKS